MQSGFDNVNKFDYLIFRFSKDLLEMMKVIGANKCSNVLELVLGDEYKEQIKEFELLELYDRVFIPIRFKIKEPSSSNSIISSKSKIVPKSVTLTTKDKIFIFYGRFVTDPLNIYKNDTFVRNKINTLKSESRRLFLPGVFKEKFIDFLNVEQICLNSITELKEMMKYYYSASSLLSKKPLGHLVSLFMTGTFDQKRDMIAQLLLSAGNDKKFLASFVLTVFSDDDEYKKIIDSLPWEMQKDLKNRVKNAKKDKSKNDDDEEDPESKLSYEERINKLAAPKKVKKKAEDMLKMIKGSRDGDSKSTKYLEGLLRIPFGKYRKEKIFEGLDEFKQELSQIKGIAEEKKLQKLSAKKSLWRHTLI